MNAVRSTRAWLLLCALLAPAAALAQSGAAVDGVVLIRRATVYSGDAIEAGPRTETDVLVRGERIAAIGRALPTPAGAHVIEADGRPLTPGLFGTESALGLIEVEAEGVTRDDSPERAGRAGNVRAAFRAVDGFNSRSTLVPIVRAQGITTAISTPAGGLVSGMGALVELRTDALDAMVSARELSLHVDLLDSGLDAAGGTRGSALSRLRQVLEEARLYGRNRGAFDRRGVRELSISRADLESLTVALAGRVPVVVRVARASDILRVLELAREYGLSLVLSGAQEGWVVAKEIAAAAVPVILRPLTNLPDAFSSLGSRADNAALLHAAGVAVIITTEGPHKLGNLRQEAGNAVAHGLPYAVALAALTSTPAVAFGLEREHGTLAVGKLANLVLWSGEPLELSSRALHVLVRGRIAPPDHRQRRLFERYRHVPPPR